MAVRRLEIAAFRCIAKAKLALHPNLNVVIGENASGKTSLLEALFFIGRGRSFRSSATAGLVQHEEPCFRVMAEAEEKGHTRRVGVEYGRSGFRLRVDGEAGRRLADLAEVVPVAAVDPEVHELVQGAPDGRRRFIDWGVFHVEHGFLGLWQRYQRLLRQRNAALKGGADASALAAWSGELAEAGEALSGARDRYLVGFSERLQAVAGELLQRQVACRHLRGWSRERGLAEALAGAEARDRQFGATQLGPHRADLALELEGRPVRDAISRGQQKLLAAAMVLSQVGLFCEQTGRQGVLLLDDPAAELDHEFLGRLLALSLALPVQLVVTGLTAAGLPTDRPHAMFHVEQGRVTQVI